VAGGAAVGIGLGYRYDDAIVPDLELRYQKLIIALLYDVNISTISAAGISRNGVELGLRIDFLNTNPMSKVIICLTGCILMTLTSLRAQDNAGPAQDTVKQVPADTSGRVVIVDTTMKIKDTTAIPKDTSAPVARDTASQSPSAPVVAQNTTPQNTTPTLSDTVDYCQQTVADTIGQVKEAPQVKEEPKTTTDAASLDGGERRSVDTRWFISPLLKFQFQDFGMLEKNRKGYLSDANTLPFTQRGNGSFAASAYKNITGRLSVSADLGISFGHVTNDNVLISQTKSKTYNLLNAAIYYHLLAASYRLQPYVTVGINDLINDVSYLSAPIGIGAKFNAKKVMVTGQLTYGYGVNKNTSNTTMYSLGIYIPLKTKNRRRKRRKTNPPITRTKKTIRKKTRLRRAAISSTIFTSTSTWIPSSSQRALER